MSEYNIAKHMAAEDPRVLGERAFSRNSLPTWDLKWHRLSTRARCAFLDEAKTTPQQTTDPYVGWGRSQPPNPDKGGVSRLKFSPAALDELVNAGFLEIRKRANPKGEADAVFVPKEINDFLTQVRSLERYHLLDPKPPSELGKHVNFCYYSGGVERMVAGVIGKAGIKDPYLRIDEARRGT